MNTRKFLGCLAASLALLMLVFSSELTLAADQATPVNDGPSGRRPVVTTTATSTPNAEPTNTVGPDGQKLRKPTAQEAHDIDPKSWPDATMSDCMTALHQHSKTHRFAFVGICESSIMNDMGEYTCRDGSLAPMYRTFILQTLSSSDETSPAFEAERISAYNELGTASGIAYSSFASPYDTRLQSEWNAGDVPEGVPLTAPNLLTVLTRMHCQLPA